MSLAESAASPSNATPRGFGPDATIDLRVADATWRCRQLQVQVDAVRREVDELESRPSGGGNTLEGRLGDLLVQAQNQIARERADARRAAAAIIAEAELESRRRLDVARHEARTLRGVAEWLRGERMDAACGPAALTLDLGPVPDE